MLSAELAAQIAARLSALMTEEAATLRVALGHLRAEHAALLSGDIDTLPALAARKSEAYARLSQLGDARSALIARAGTQTSKEALDALFASGPEWAACRQPFADLLALAREAHDANQSNGEMIRAQMKSSQQALAVLMSAAEQASTYGPDGQSTTLTSRRSFGSA
ncbi:Putative FlgN family protein [Methyloversatilis universalis FAM5]|uniref:FlgN family protein n=1 Tax=Methyloversatilis universalis (strain ATCC BAA-1314 / DSM 25237 / JCM 13912 / CCUG 52030 / FAM5) TaxID=1000565 RepID=F5REB9_METUF|nr:flagellar protein FlgN [Methyloversatilis universalis]EGK71250.1 Putative FlgN family protein [Methyloversatilis universalis FAM5]